MTKILRCLKRIVKPRLCASVLSVIVAKYLHAQDLSQRYPFAIFELPTLGGSYSNGWTLNNSGSVVGTSFLPVNEFHAALWNEARNPLDLGTFGGEDSECRGINSLGWVVGGAQTQEQTGFELSAFLWKNGQMTNLGYLPGGNEAEAFSINDSGRIVGISSITTPNDGSTRAFLWQDGEMTQLDSPANYWSTYAIAINDSGLVAGQGFDNDWRSWRPVIWENGHIRDLGTFRSDNIGVGVAIGVNDAGEVVGYTEYDIDGNFQAFLYHDRQMYPLPMMPEWFCSYAWSINSHNQIVGAGRVLGNAIDDACIWERHQPVRYLNDLIPPYSNWRVNEALRNNDLGQITGNGHRLDDLDHYKGYLITPIHQTIQLSRAQPGTAGVVNTLKVYGATPGAQVTFIYGDKGGGSAIPGCTLEQNALQIDSPIVLATITANANGVAALRGYVSSGAQGRTVLIQAFVQNECGVSQLVVQRFE